jgi:hypothetical protein
MDQLLKQHVNEVTEKARRIFNAVTTAAKLYGLEARDLDDPDIHKLSNFLDNEMGPTIQMIYHSKLVSPEGNLKLDNVMQGIFLIRQLVKNMENQDEEMFYRDLDHLDSLNLLPVGDG